MKRNLTPPTLPLKPGDDPTDALNRIYGMGRSYPDGRPHDAPRVGSPQPHPQNSKGIAAEGHAVNLPITPALDRRQQAPQDPEDRQAPGYDNDATGWVRGFGSKMHPHFDSGGSGFRYGKK